MRGHYCITTGWLAWLRTQYVFECDSDVCNSNIHSHGVIWTPDSGWGCISVHALRKRSLWGFDLWPGTLSYSAVEASRLYLHGPLHTKAHSQGVKARAQWTHSADYLGSTETPGWWTCNSSKASAVNSSLRRHEHRQTQSFVWNTFVSRHLLSQMRGRDRWCKNNANTVTRDRRCFIKNPHQRCRHVLSGFVNELGRTIIQTLIHICACHYYIVLCGLEQQQNEILCCMIRSYVIEYMFYYVFEWFHNVCIV